MQELPDIVLPGEPVSDTARERTRHSGSVATANWALAFATILFSALVALGITLIGRDAIMSLFIPVEAKPHPHTARIDALQSKMDALKNDLVGVQSLINAQQTTAHDESFEQDKIAQRVMVIERFATDLEQKIKKHQATQAQHAIRKKESVKTPKPAPVIPPVLVSVRNVAGVPYVALRDGLDSSNLLKPGDTWRGWTFIDLDPSRNAATFQYQGVVRELSL